MPLTHLPYNLPGKAYRSPMPFSAFDPYNEVFPAYLEQDISTVVLFPDDAECLVRSGRDLRKFYEQEGIQVLHLPTGDFHAPKIKALRQIVEEAYALLNKGNNIAVHCYAGIGRTGTFAACLARRVFGFSGEMAIEWTRKIIPGAIEVEEQAETVLIY
jgi:protein-tyrosine phosphatase